VPPYIDRLGPAFLVKCEDVIRPFQENKSPKNGEFSERKASGLGSFNFWNYLSKNISPILDS
jgi:hypothetical protein